MTDPTDLDRPPTIDYRLELYLNLLERERDARPAEVLLADEIHRLRRQAVALFDEIDRLRHTIRRSREEVEAEAWPTLVALARRLRSTYTVRDRNPDDPVFEVAFDPADLEPVEGTSISWLRDSDRPGVRILRLEERPAAFDPEEDPF